MLKQKAWAPFLLLLLALAVGETIAVHAYFTSRFPGGNDLYPRWRGAQLFWQDGVNPYSDEATAAIQQDIYGRLARPGEDQVLFVYPFYTVFLLLPLIAFPYDWVQAIWIVLLQFGIVGGVVAMLRFLRWRQSPGLLAATLLWSVLFYTGLRTIVLGQFAGLVFAAMMGCLLALRQQRYGTAAALLALTTVKPQMSFLFVPALLLWGVGQRRWRFIGAFGGAMALLFAVSFLLVPTWLTQFVQQVFLYPSYTVVGSPVHILSRVYAPWLGRPFEIAVILLALAIMLWQWRRLPQLAVGSGGFLFVMGVTLLATNLVSPQTATTNYIMLYLPVLGALNMATQEAQRGWLWVVGTYGVTLVGVWWLFLATVRGDAESPIMFLPLPLWVLAALLWPGWRDRRGAAYA